MKPVQHLHIGLLGGGQLGRMMLQSAADLNLRIDVMDPDKEAPCRHMTPSFTHGKLTDFDNVYRFGKGKDLLTIEIENVNTEALAKLRDEGVKVYPQPEVIELIQDKGMQKMFFQRNGIPSADFFLVENKEQIAKYAGFFPFFQKLRRGGYDGKGVVKLKDPDRLENAFDAPSVLERAVSCAKELSVIVARSPRGEVKCFPIVECQFSEKANLVEFLFSPASVSKKISAEAERIAINVAEKLGIIGLLAVEMFLSTDGQILVNEIAPRPHNSGHHTIEGNVTSQFAQHLRAILDLPLGDTSIIRPAVMVNLLGEEGFSGPAVYQGLEDAMKFKSVFVHLYGKSHTKPYRKMGHVTVLDDDLNKAKQKGRLIIETLKVKS